jgi:hypothetical protein
VNRPARPSTERLSRRRHRSPSNANRLKDRDPSGAESSQDHRQIPTGSVCALGVCLVDSHDVGRVFFHGRTPPLLPATHVRLLMYSTDYWERQIPTSQVAAAAWPKVVVSGAHDPAQESVCDATAKAIKAERLTLAGAGHLVLRAPGFNDLLRRVWTT